MPIPYDVHTTDMVVDKEPLFISTKCRRSKLSFHCLDIFGRVRTPSNGQLRYAVGPESSLGQHASVKPYGRQPGCFSSADLSFMSPMSRYVSSMPCLRDLKNMKKISRSSR